MGSKERREVRFSTPKSRAVSVRLNRNEELELTQEARRRGMKLSSMIKTAALEAARRAGADVPPSPQVGADDYQLMIHQPERSDGVSGTATDSLDGTVRDFGAIAAG